LLAIALIESASVLTEQTEILAARNLVLRRAIHIVGSFAAISLLVVFIPDGEWRFVAARNAAAFVGIGYILVSVDRRALASVTVVMVAAISWLLGTSGPFDPPAWWAFVVHDASSRSAILVAAATAGTGVVVYLATPRARSRRIQGLR